MTYRTTLLALTLSLLAACGGGTIERYAVPASSQTADLPRISSRYGSIELREVSLPSYASSEEIAKRGETGAITSESSLLWADQPSRGMTLELARLLGLMTRAQVAAEPWPFLDRAAALVDIRVEQMLADADGTFRLSGQYYVAPDSGVGGRSGLFDLSAPIVGEGASAIAAARGQVVRSLAEEIARRGLR
ncbi:PqiC family protein [Pseudooceanicola atlanticus]|uniref:ABC-type transport auxiliary lipoprotein component domain-containing protein n=1 Tax=Pseudooceanicola atlanticus TaxID=1461694 RepID=A0A0A0EER3_9RHOB|nr:ABC-type transport auxiliary lipoprotein family protein [Pseudooceanicola atlanticus]KGM49446.1 hypothetical protein ATO9_05330 [Pseudooceanicola atlanticus]